MKDTNITNSDLLTNEVEINLNVLYALVLYEVGGEVDDADVVTIDKCALGQRTMKLLK
jgi:hypothetical protein